MVFFINPLYMCTGVSDRGLTEAYTHQTQNDGRSGSAAQPCSQLETLCALTRDACLLVSTGTGPVSKIRNSDIRNYNDILAEVPLVSIG